MAIRKSSNSGIPFGNTAGRPAAQTGQPYFNGEVGRLELYTDTGWQNIVQETPGIASITGTYLESTNSGTFIISGTNFVSGAIASAIGTNGVEVQAQSTTYNSIVQLTAVFTNLSNTYEPYDIKVTNPSNLFGMIPDALYVNASPVWQQSSGSLGTFNEGSSVNISALATDPESLPLVFSLASGTLPSGLSLNSSTGTITGTLNGVAANTTYTFTISVTDSENTTLSRSFNITVNTIVSWNTPSGSIGTITPNIDPVYSYQLSATGLGSTLSYSILSGSLPQGLTLSSSGLISGTTETVAVQTISTFTVRVSDGQVSADRQFTITRNTASTSTFSYTGGWQSFVVPANITKVKAFVWGAGGGGAFDSWAYGWGGGSGGFASATINVTQGQQMFIACGQAGTSSIAFSGGGGGMSGVFSNSTFDRSNAVVIAGGGGGGGNSRISSVNLSGGAGGGSSGNSGGTQTTTGAIAPTGGTQSSAGTAGIKGSGSGTSGQAGDSMRGGLPGEYTSGGYVYRFGEGPNPTTSRFLGGGGGAGYYGGGGGCYEELQNMQGGAGGSGYVGGNPSFSIVSGSTTLTAGNNGNATGNSGLTVSPPQTSLSYYGDNAGVGAGGGGSGSQGGHGRVVLVY